MPIFNKKLPKAAPPEPEPEPVPVQEVEDSSSSSSGWYYAWFFGTATGDKFCDKLNIFSPLLFKFLPSK